MTDKGIRLPLLRGAALIATVLGFSALALPASADVTLNNDQVMALRQAAMRSNNTLASVMKGVAGGTVTITKDQLRQIGGSWLALGKALPILFPAGSGMPGIANSKAKPEIWSNAADFKVKLDAFADATAKFREPAVAGDMDASKAAFAAVDKACDVCHEAYRAR